MTYPPITRIGDIFKVGDRSILVGHVNVEWGIYDDCIEQSPTEYIGNIIENPDLIKLLGH